MRILVTNDDGIGSPGLAALVTRLTQLGHDLLVLAPVENCTGAAGAIGAIGIPHCFDCVRWVFTDAPEVPAYGVDAYPAMCVLAAMLGAFGQPPDVIFSGINQGPNVGRSIIHSGTVSAAMTGALHGARGLAVSIASHKDGKNWPTAAELAASSLDWLMAQPAGTLVNINVPDLRSDQIRGVRSASLAPLSQLRTALVQSDSRQQLKLDIATGSDPEETDGALLDRGFATVTPLIGISNGDLSTIEDLAVLLNR